MIFRIALVSLFAVVATSSLMSMEEQNKACLNFVTDVNCYIVGHPKTIEMVRGLRMDLFCVVQPSTPEDFVAFTNGIFDAVNKKETVKFPCSLQYPDKNDFVVKKNVVAKLTPLEAIQQMNKKVLFIKIQEIAMTPQKSKKRLNFIVNNDKQIMAYSKENMEFAIEPSEFVGKSIIDVLPLSKEDRESVAQGFCTAVEKNEVVKVPYLLDMLAEQKNFIAKIVALQYIEKDENMFFVKVQEAKK